MNCEQQTRTTPVADRPTIHEFKSGALYSVSQVKRLFARSDQWTRDAIRSGKLEGVKLGGVGPFLISGQSILILYGQLQLAEDLTSPSVPVVSEATAVDREFARSAELNAKGKGARS